MEHAVDDPESQCGLCDCQSPGPDRDQAQPDAVAVIRAGGRFIYNLRVRYPQKPSRALWRLAWLRSRFPSTTLTLVSTSLCSRCWMNSNAGSTPMFPCRSMTGE